MRFTNRRQFISAAVVGTTALAKLVTAFADNPSLSNRGIGLTGQEFVAMWGEPDSRMRVGSGVYYTGLNTVASSAHLRIKDDERISHIEVHPTENTELISDSADIIFGMFIPEDFTHIETVGDSDTYTMHFHSDWLRERFAEKIKTWNPPRYSGEVGDFTVEISVDEDTTIIKEMNFYTSRSLQYQYSDYDVYSE